MPSDNSCLVVGDVNIDFNVKTDYYPPEGGETHAKESVFRLGGSGCSTALILNKIGIPTTLAANIGTDMFAEFALTHIQSLGLGTKYIQKNDDIPTGFFMILITGEGLRTMFGNRGANATPILLTSIKPEIDLVQHVHFSGYNLLGDDQAKAMLETMHYCHQTGKSISLDPGTHTCKAVPERIFEALSMVDFFLPNEIEIQILTGKSGEDAQISAILEAGCKAVVLKKGNEGSRFISNYMDISIPEISDSTEQIYDSTGAGDSFNAGFLYGLLNSKSMKKCLQIGNASGFLIITKPFGTIDLLKDDKLKQRINNYAK